MVSALDRTSLSDVVAWFPIHLYTFQTEALSNRTSAIICYCLLRVSMDYTTGSPFDNCPVLTGSFCTWRGRAVPTATIARTDVSSYNGLVEKQ